MKVYAINGSPRKNENTATLLKKALEGVKASSPNEEIETEIINLYDLNYTGCKSCFVCKRIGSKSYGKCAIRDDLHDVLEKLADADGIIFGSPIYLGDVSAMMRALLERLTYQYTNFDDFSKPYFTGNLKTAFIYTMNAPGGFFDAVYKKYEDMLGSYFEYIGTVDSTEALQVDDYSKYNMAYFNEAERKERREKVFPDDCRKAFDLGKAIANG